MPAPGATSSSRFTVALRWSSPLTLLALLLVPALWLGGCGTTARSGRDGPGANPPANLAHLPDAEPRIEPIRSGGANKPYQALGRDYVPLTRDLPFNERGLASWYGRAFQGKRTSSGEPYDMYAMTAAHPTLPIPSYARIRNPANGREIVVRINDRGPFHPGRIVDLSYAAALRLDVLRGVAPVELDRITFDEIRAGRWRPAGERKPTPNEPAPTELARGETGNAPSTSSPPGTVSAGWPGPAALPLTQVAVSPSLSAAPSPSAQLLSPSPPSPPSDPPLPIVSAALVPATPSAAPSPRGFWVQLGAFREADGADSFERRIAADVDWLGPLLATFSEAALYRVQAGPYVSRDEAQAAAARMREALGLVPMVVERR